MKLCNKSAISGDNWRCTTLCQVLRIP